MSKMSDDEKSKRDPRVKRIRGYYSELITDKDSPEKLTNLPGAKRTTNSLWQIKTEKQAPIITKLPKSSKEVFLAPAERWITFEEDRHIVKSTLILIKSYILNY